MTRFRLALNHLALFAAAIATVVVALKSVLTR